MIDKEDLERLDERYVRISDCSDTQSENAKKFANDDTRLRLYEQKMNMWSKLFWAIASATIGQLAVSMFNLIRG